MKCNLIFYMARKTGNCELSLRKKLATVDKSIDNIYLAASPEELGKMLQTALAENNTVLFTISGENPPKNAGIEVLISNALAGSLPHPKVSEISNQIDPSRDGYLLEKGTQKIVLLSDSPVEIEEMASSALLKKIFGIKGQPKRSLHKVSLR